MTIAVSVKNMSNLLNNHGFTIVQLAILIVLGLIVFFSGYVVDSEGYSAWMYFSTTFFILLFVGVVFFFAKK